MAKQMWVYFYHNKKVLLKYTLKDESPGERRETIKLLAYEHKIPEEEITVNFGGDKKGEQSC